MQVQKVREALEMTKQFQKRAEEVLSQAGSSTNFLLCDGRHAKILKKASMHAIQALTEMRRP
jgi:CDGSH-type Zn-finger protein